LNQVGERGLIAPFGEPRHYAVMHPGAHEGAHGRLVVAHGAGPESTIDIAKDRNREASIGTLGLTRCAKRLDQEPR
jgi:hypothetical protein